MELKKYLAKSNGEDIISHTNKVIENIKLLIPDYNLNQIDENILINSAILHDIGKLTEKTQSYLKKQQSILDNDKIKYTHNIIGWYFIMTYTNIQYKDKIANLVLWHHANYDACDNLDIKLVDISKYIKPNDLILMKEFCNHYNIPLNQIEDENLQLDTQFYRLDNLLRSILITADVSASANQNVNHLFKQNTNDLSQLNPDFLNSDRTKKQLEILNQITQNNTTIVKAPTGFGKTIIGLLFTMKSDKNVIWVCPTNTIAESIYDDILNDMKLINLNLNVELYLTGERIKANNNLPEFTSKLIITNIDNYIKPSVTNNYGIRCLMIYNCNAIFDEFHQYDDMKCALNAAFNNIMDKRHNQLNSTTLMLTATQSPFRFLNVNAKPINILPNQNQHYQPIHNQKYNINFHNNTPTELMKGEFIFFTHVVDDVQEYYKNYNGPKLISHGRYLDDDKNYRKQLVLSNYGKNGPRIQYAVFTNQILTTSCDYSVKTMFIKCPTIKEFVQAIGRINRWGNLGETNIHIILNKNKNDQTFIGSTDENNLQQIFITELQQQFQNLPLTLNDIYTFYNTFTLKYKSLINQISRENLNISKNMLKNVFPKRKKLTNYNIKITNNNKMRKSSAYNEIFIYVKRTNNNHWVTINYNVNNLIGLTKTFNENQKTYINQIKKIKELENYNKYKLITPETIIKDAIFYDSPYPVFNYQYDEELGLIKI
jgi:CRISPR-associated endonuclease Cas3-HD